MKKRSQKKEDVEALNSELGKVSTVILTTFEGITVAEDTQLRRAVQAAGGRYRVVKNILAGRAGAGTPSESVLKDLSGTNSISYTEADPVALVKALTKVAKAVPAFRFKSGLVEGRVVSIADIQVLALLGSRDELIGRLMFLLQAPVQRMASALAGVTRNLAVTVQEAVKAEKFSQQ